MTRFEYAAIFYGIVVALAVEIVLLRLHRLLAARHRVRWHWMALATAVNGFPRLDPALALATDAPMP